MKRAVEAVKREERPYITIPIPYGFVRVAIADIYYVDVYGHQLSFHTNGGSVETRGKISDYEQKLKVSGFLRCNRSCLVNTAHIKKIENFDVDMGIVKLSISRNYYRDFYGEAIKILSKGAKE
jgi:DNA-binding LytR/AlgR family response regulator